MTGAQTEAHNGETFVGRATELADLRAGVDSLFAGRGRLFLLAGEAGIGKTRLADKIAAEAERRGARALWGRSWESGGAPSYWPWSQIVRAYVANRQAAAPDALELMPVLTSLTQPQVGAATAEREPEQARFQLFDATTRFLQAAARRQPLVMILDDLHAADAASLLLLRFIARELRAAPWLIIGTYRDAEAARTPTTVQLLAEIAREGQRVPLRGLTRSETYAYIEQATAGATAETLVDSVYQVTEGNPFFLTEVARLLERAAGTTTRSDATTIRLAIPDEVRAAIRQRLAALSPTTMRVLSIAAVIGREFDLALLVHTAAADSDRAVVYRSVDEARQLNVIGTCDGDTQRFSFTHLLIRDTLYDDLPSADRAGLHRRIGEAMETLYAANQALYLAEMAHHFAYAAAGGSIDKAVQYSQRAGDRAMSLLGYEEAVGHYQHALDCLDLRRFEAGHNDGVLRCTLMLALGDAQWGASNLEAMRTTFQRAAEIADALHGPERGPLLARAALGLGGRQQRAHVVLDDVVVDLLEKALAALDESDSILRARVLARLGYALYSQPGSYDRRTVLVDEAVAMARRIGDLHTLHWVLNDSRWALWGPDNLEARLRIGDEIMAIADQLKDREMLITEHSWRLVDFLELADRAAVDAELKVFTRLAHEIQLPWYHRYVNRFSALKATMEGRFGDAETLAEEALTTSHRMQQQDTLLIYATQMMTLRFEQGRLDELETGLQSLVAQYPAVPIWRYLLPHLHAEQRRVEVTRGEFERIIVRGLHDLPRDYLRLANAAYLAEVASFLGARAAAAELYDMIAPYGQRCIVIGFGIACLGSVARPLGLLAATLERWSVARSHFETALEINNRMRAWPALARTHLAYADMLLRSPEASTADRRQAESMMRMAVQRADELGMTALAAQVRATAKEHQLALEAGPAVDGATRLRTADEALVASFRRDHDHWALAFGGEGFRLKDLRGLGYIAHLLQHPGQQFHATQMVALFEPMEQEASDNSQLRQRVIVLQEELSDAQAMNDLGRIDALHSEMERLTDELVAGAGVAGSKAKSAERARVSVTKRISIALRRIGEHDPALARYLENNVKTGSYCSYSPDPSQVVRWQL